MAVTYTHNINGSLTQIRPLAGRRGRPPGRGRARSPPNWSARSRTRSLTACGAPDHRALAGSVLGRGTPDRIASHDEQALLDAAHEDVPAREEGIVSPGPVELR